jgi:hypothetical protein
VFARVWLCLLGGLPMVIPLGKDLAASCTLRAPKTECCEKCEVKYVYNMTRTGTGWGFSFLGVDYERAQRLAEARAARNARRALERESDVVPCPRCGWIQSHMARVVRGGAYTGWTVTGVALLAVAVILGAILASFYERPPRPSPTLVFWFAAPAALCALLGIGLFATGRIRRARIDPNARDVEERKCWGRQRALLAEELEAMKQAVEAQGTLEELPPLARDILAHQAGGQDEGAIRRRT